MEKTESPLVVILIVNWNGLDDTLECLASLRKIHYEHYRIVLVDNGSSGNDVTVLKGLSDELVEIIENDKNLGYAKGVNVGIKYVEAKYSPDYFLLLNNDTVVDPDFLNQLVDAVELSDVVGIVGPKVYFYDSPGEIQGIGAKINMFTGDPSYIGFKKMDVGQYENVLEMDWVGPCELVKADVFKKIGYFDENYFAYWEDVDFCLRAKKAGFKICYFPGAKVWHKLGGSSRGASDSVYYYMARNRIWFMKKNASKFKYLCFMAYLCILQVWILTLRLLLTRKMGRLKAFWQGISDGFSGKNKLSQYGISLQT
ncbi:MAG: glycosyltransferase family 2 protein [Dehalococcoidia bacterium]